MNNPVNVLIVEDLKTDFELAQREIRKSVKGCRFRQAETRAEFLDALETFRPDVILSDYSLPRFDGMKALELAVEHAPLTPLIIWTGSLSEDVAVECMKAGASNYIIKENIKRLGPAVVHALDKRQLLLERKQAELRYQALFEQSHDAIFILDLEGRHIAFNRRAMDMLSYSHEEMLGLSVKDLSAEPEQSEKVLHKLLNGELVPPYERLFRKKDGGIVPVEINVELVRDARGNPLHIQSIVRDITERKQTVEKLRASEARFSTVFHASPVGICVTRIADGRLMDANDSFLKMMEYSRDEALHRTTLELDLWEKPEQRTRVVNTLLERGEVSNVEIGFRKKSGEIGRSLTSAELIELDGEQYILSMLNDVTGLKRAEIELQQMNDDLALLNAINEAVIRGESLNTIMNLLAEEMKRLFSSMGTTIYMLNPDGQSLTMRQFSMLPAIVKKIEGLIGSSIPQVRIPIREDGYFHKVLEAKDGLIVSDPREIQEWMEEFAETDLLSPAARRAMRRLIPQIYRVLDIRSVISVPLISEGKTVGLMDVSSTKLFAENDLRRIEKIARQLTAAIQRQQANERIQRSEEFLQSVQNALSASLAILDETGTIVQVNSAWRAFGERNGLTHPEHGVGLNYLEICDSVTGPDAGEAQKVAAAIREVIAGEKDRARFEYSCHSPAEERWFVLRITKFEDRERRWVVMAHENITERKQAEQDLYESEERYRGLFENSPIGIWEEDFSEVKKYLDSLKRQGVTDFREYFASHPRDMVECNRMIRILNVNDTAVRMFGAKSKEDLLKFTNDTTSLGEEEHNLEDFVAIAEGRLSNSWEGLDSKLDGEPVEISLTWSVMPGHEGDLSRVVVTTTDITERKQAETALRESEERYRSLFDRMLDGVYRSTHEGRFVDVNSAMVEMFGYASRDEMMAVDIKRELYFSPEERGSHLLDTGQEEVDIYRMRRKDGSEIWVEDRGSYVHDEHGNIIYHEGILRDVTERKKAEEALNESQARYHSLFENSPISLWEEDFSQVKSFFDRLRETGVVDFHAYFDEHPGAVMECAGMVKILDINRATLDLVGAADKAELMGALTDSLSDEAWSNVKAELVTLAEGRTFFAGEEVFYTTNGDKRDVLINLTVAPGYEETLGKVFVSILDITDRKRAETAEREQRALAEALRDTAETLNSTLDYGNVLDQILTAVGRVVPHDTASIMLIENDSANVVRAQGFDKRGFEAEAMGVELPLDTTVNLRQMLDTKQPVVISDTQSYAGWKKLRATDWLRSNVGAPILISGEVNGFILLDSETPGFFNLVHAERLQAFANQAALAIQNARLLGQAQEEIAERKQAEKALQEAELKYRNLVERLPVIVYTSEIGADGRWTYISPQVEALLGFTPEEWMTDSGLWYQQMHPDDRDRHQQVEEQAWTRGEAFDAEYRLRRKDGRELWIRDVGVIFASPEGGPPIVQGTLMDVTDRRRAEEELRRSHSLLNAALESTKDGILVVGEDRRISSFNRKFLELWRIPYKLAVKKDDHALLNFVLDQLKDPEAFITKVEELYRTPGADSFDELEFKDGRVFERHSQPQRLGRAIVGRVWSFRDVTERKRAERELRESEERFRQLADNIQEMFWITDILNHKEDYLSPAYEMIWGRPLEEGLAGSVEAFLDTVHPDDRSVVVPILEKQRQGSRTEMEYRITRPDGSVRWIWDRAFPILDDAGNVARVAGIAADITERKRAEQELRESELKIQNIIQHSNSMFYTHTPDHVLTYVSPQSRQILDCEPEEAMRRWQEWLSDHPANAAGIEATERAIRTGERQPPYELELITKTGRRIWVRVDESPLVKEGKTDSIIGSLTDITERKQAENALRESQVRFAGVVNSAMDAVISVDSKQRIVLFNPAAERTFGCPADEALGQPVERFIPDRYRAAHKDHIINFGKTGITGRDMGHLGTLNGLRSDGTEFPIEASISHIEAGGQHLYTVILRDITERKKLERERQLLSSAIAASLNEVYLFDAETLKFMFVNNGALSNLGYTLEEALQLTPLDLKPEFTRESFQLLIAPLLQHQKPLQVFETKHRRADGSLYPAEVHLQLFEHDGQRVFLAVIQDITERRRTEEQLRKLSRAVEQTASTIVITDTDGRIEYVNPKFVEKTGYAYEEAIGQNPRILKSGRTPPEEYERLWNAITSGEDWQGELLNRKKNGELYWESATISPIFNERGETTHFIAVKEDITERKQIEKDTQRHLAELEALYENGLAVGQLLEPRQIGERVIQTFVKHLSWHHVTIRLLKGGSDVLELVAYSLPHLKEDERGVTEQNFTNRINRVGQGMSGWVIQTGEPIRTGSVRVYPQYVDTYEGIQSGLYMPLKIGERVIGVISVESEQPDAFSAQDERLLATLASQAAVAFENARLYQSAQQELAERKRVEEALRDSETHYRELADSITDIFFELDQDMRYTHWNKASEMLTGVPAKDAIHKTMHDIFGKSEEQERIGRVYENVLETHRPRTFETIFRLNNEKHSFEINAYPSARGVAVVAKDVTERKRSETLQQKRFELMEYSAHHTLEELTQRMVDEVSELTGSEIGFFHFVEDDQTTLGMQVWSTNTFKLFDVPDSKGTHLSLDQAGVWAEAARQRRSIIQNEYESLPNKRGLPQGHAAIQREMVIPIIRNDRIVAVMGLGNKAQDYTQQDLETASQLADYAWDITERKQMELALASERNLLAQRVEERTAELIKANSNLARALRVKDEFLANMSHELRTPLNAILGLSESLAEQIAGPLNEKQLKYITTIGESGHHLLSLINDILDLAKIEAGQITLDINKVDVHGVCQASLRMVKQLAQKKNQEMIVTIDDNIGLMWADERRLKQMLVNLLSNAVKFTPENGVLGLDVRGDEEGNRVEISVWDNGIGIRESDLPRLFQPFVQLDAGLARESTGTGLGLALVSQMARLHGGSVSVASEPGKGSRFTLTLPWEPALAQDTVVRLRNTGKLVLPEAGPAAKRNILLVEDTLEVIMMLKDYLETAGYQVATAQDGMEGISQAKLTHPDLILMDIQMPRMDGIEAAKILRADPNFKQVPIIALTALAMPNDRERCIEAGMDDYISKPVNLRALIRIMEKCFSTGEEKTRPT